jgi:hypothetical protein
VTVLSRTEPLVRDARERQPRQPHHRKASRLAEPVNLAVLPFAKHDLEPRLVAFDPQPMHLGGSSGATVDLDALLPALEIRVADDPGDLRDVHLGRLLSRVEQRHGEVPVVREEQRPARVEVEAPHRNDARPDATHVLRHGRSPLGIRHGADDVPRLVEDDVHELLTGNGGTVHLDPVHIRVGLGPELGHDLPVHRDPPRRDELLGLPARRDAGLSEHFLETLGGHGLAVAERPPAV